MSDPLQSFAPRYAVNPQTGKVFRAANGTWEPVDTAKDEAGDIYIVENGQWRPFQRGNSEITAASTRANSARQAGQPIANSDIAALGRPDFSEAAFSALPPAASGAGPTQPEVNEWLGAMQAGGATKREYDRVQRMDQIDRNLPDNDLKERFIAFANAPTLGNAPRLAAGVQTLGALAATPFVDGDIIDREGISGATQTFLDEARVHQRRGREERPFESMGLEVIPALLTGKTLIDDVGKKILPGTTTTSNVARVMGVGTGYGAVYGASQDESGTLQGAGEGALFGGAIGAATGGLFKAAEAPATVVARTGKQAGASIYDALASLVGKQGGARDKVALEVAEAAVRRSMDRSGLTFEQIMDLAKKYEGKPAVFAEIIGQDAVNALTALTRRPGSTPQKAQDIIEERFYGRPDRMKGDVEDATGIQIGQLDETLQTQLAERQAAAKPIYEALYKRFNKIEDFRQPGQTGQVQKRLNRLGRTPLAKRHLQLAKDAVATAAGRRNIAISKMSKMEYWDMVKRSLDDAINSAKSKGEDRTRVGEGIEDLVGLKDDLVTELDRLTGGAYAAAREAGGEAPRLKAAATAGQKALQARNPRDVAKTVAATLSQDLPALRAGIVDDLGTRIDKGMTPGRVRVPDVSGKLREGLGEEAANKLINRFDAEATLSETGARWAPRMNSVTGTVMESGATALGDDLVNAGFNLATGNKVGLMRQAINFMRQRGFSQRQMDAIGDLLLSSPEEGLKRLRMMAPDGTPLPAGRTNAFASNAAAPSSSDEVSPPTPANAFSNNERGSGLGTRAADAAAVAAVASGGGTAQADTGGAVAELDAANEQVRVANERVLQIERTAMPQLEADLRLMEDPEADPFALQELLARRGLYEGEIDGKIGTESRKAIAANREIIREEIQTQRVELNNARQELEAARKAVTSAEMRQSLEAAETNPLVKTGSDLASGAAFLGGIYLAGRARQGAVKEYTKAAKSAATKANALLNRGKLYPQATVGPNSTNVRASNLNEFWKQGGAQNRVPFKTDDQGQWSARKNAKEPTQLFKAPRYLDNDKKFILATGLESQATRVAADHFKEEREKAQADMDLAYEAGDSVAFDAALKRRNMADGGEAFFRILERLGYGLAAGRALGGLKAYPTVNANIKAAEAERALILQGLQKQKSVSAVSKNANTKPEQ